MPLRHNNSETLQSLQKLSLIYPKYFVAINEGAFLKGWVGASAMRQWLPVNRTRVVCAVQEGYYVFREIAADSEDATKPLSGPNQWPSEHLVPG